MNSKKSKTLKFTLSVEYIENEDATHLTIGEFIMPLDASDDHVCDVNLLGEILGKPTALVARIACQSLDVALKRHIEHGGSDTVEMLNDLHVDPNGDIRNVRP